MNASESSSTVDYLTVQKGGDHYKHLSMQPIMFGEINGIGNCQAYAVKYITRYKDKNGKLDLQKAAHCIELLIQFTYSNHFQIATQQKCFTWNITPEDYCIANKLDGKQSAAIILVCRFTCKLHLDEALIAVNELIADCPKEKFIPDRKDKIINRLAQTALIAKNRLDDWWLATQHAGYIDLRHQTKKTISLIDLDMNVVEELIK